MLNWEFAYVKVVAKWLIRWVLSAAACVYLLTVGPFFRRSREILWQVRLDLGLARRPKADDAGGAAAVLPTASPQSVIDDAMVYLAAE